MISYTRIISFVPALCNTSIPEFLGRMPQHPGKRPQVAVDVPIYSEKC